MDKIDSATRSRVMASVHSKNTKPEMVVRSLAHRLGYRYRLHRKDLPGKPDLVFPKRHIAIFVHGCFWHGHDCAHGSRLPTSNIDYWQDKIKRNTERDSRAQKELIDLGWQPIVIWECQIRQKDFQQILVNLLA